MVLRPTVKMILLELCRFIVLNYVVLGSVSRGWHDSLSGTYGQKKERLAQVYGFSIQKNLNNKT
jgi:hypothetical protein